MADLLGDIASPDVQKMIKKHWPWFVAGGIGFVGIAYWYLTRTSTASNTAATTAATPNYVVGESSGSTTPVDDTAVNDQTQIALANIAATAQTYGQQLSSYTAIQNNNILTAGENYQTLVNANATQNDTLAATAALQNTDMANALVQGFSTYATSTAQIATAAASSTASIASSNDAANGSNVLAQTLQGVGSIVSGITGPLQSMGGGVMSGLSNNSPVTGGGNSSGISGIASTAATLAPLLALA